MILIETAFAIGISSPSINAYLEIYNNYKDKAGFKERLGELNAIGEAKKRLRHIREPPSFPAKRFIASSSQPDV
jgi:hypothetical protein